MPTLHLIGGATHHAGIHRIHSPKLDGEGKPEKGPEKGLVTTTFVDGVARVDDVGTAAWLKEKGHAAEVATAGYGLCQPGIGPVLEHDESGTPFVVQAAQPAAAGPTTEPPKGGKEKV